jgi:hypothetical protein
MRSKMVAAVSLGGPIALALLMAALILTPASVWHAPSVDAVYSGFDPNLLYVSPSGPSKGAGSVQVAPSSLTITATPGSHPTVHLLTTPLAFSATFDVVIAAEDATTEPLRVGIWSPVTREGYFLVFDRDASNALIAESIVNGQPGEDLLGGTVQRSAVLGQFVVGNTYHVEFALDKAKQTVRVHVASQGPLPVGPNALRVGTASTGVIEVESTSIAVAPGATYSFGGWINRVAAKGTSAIGVIWFDRLGRLLPSDPNRWWLSDLAVAGWTQEQLQATAPLGARFAHLFLGVGPASTYLFARVFFRNSSQPGTNLAPNGTFDGGLSGWDTTSGSRNDIGVAQVGETSVIAATDAPQAFLAFRPTLTLSASSGQGTSRATISNLVIILPSQPSSAGEEARKIDDPRALLLIASLWGAGVVAIVLGMAVWTARRTTALVSGGRVKLWGRRHSMNRRGEISSVVTSSHELAGERGTGTNWLRLAVAAIGFVVAGTTYLLLNSLLFRAASPHFDVLSSEIWTYIAVQEGMPALYYHSLLVPAAAAWNGVPVHEAVFSYGITKAYYYLAVGWLYQLWASQPSALPTGSLQALLKSLNVIFGLADGLLTYLILKRIVGSVSAAGSAALLVLNPAMIFVMSVWGSTESISIFFVLASILSAERSKPLPAWLLLVAAAFTRPQMFIVAFFLALVYLRKFGVGQNARAIPWTMIVFFLALGPFAWAISPSLPVDYIVSTVAYHLGNAQADPGYLGTSPGYYSVWTLPLEYVNGHHGLDRMWSESTQFVFGSFTYARVGTVLSVAFILMVGIVLFFTKRSSRAPGGYLLIVAFGVLGWLMLTPGLISRYFLYGVVAVILCRQALSLFTYLWAVLSLTAITLLTSYGHIALDFLGYGTTSSLVNPLNNQVSHFVFTAFSDDRIITAGTVLNILILLLLGVRAVQGLRNASDFAPLRSQIQAGVTE